MKSGWLLFALTSLVFSQAFEFSVKTRTDFGLQGADIAMKFGAVKPFFSFDLLGIAAKYSSSSIDWDATWVYDAASNDWVNMGFHRSEYAFNGKGSVLLLMPTIGARYYIKQGVISPFVQGSLSKAVTIPNLEYTNVSVEYDSSGNMRERHTDKYKNGKYTDTDEYFNSNGSLNRKEIYEDDDSELAKSIQKLLSPWGIGAGVGVDYKVNDNFVIFGEYGLKLYLFNSGEATTTDTDGDGKDDWKSTFKQEISGSLKFVSSALGVRFLF